jgi:hypothetical protein
MLEPKTDKETIFVGYFNKMLSKYAGITEKQYD